MMAYQEIAQTLSGHLRVTPHGANMGEQDS
jgi:hypothetical protein